MFIKLEAHVNYSYTLPLVHSVIIESVMANIYRSFVIIIINLLVYYSFIYLVGSNLQFLLSHATLSFHTISMLIKKHNKTFWREIE